MWGSFFFFFDCSAQYSEEDDGEGCEQADGSKGSVLFNNHYSGWSVKGPVRSVQEDPEAEMKYYISTLLAFLVTSEGENETTGSF